MEKWGFGSSVFLVDKAGFDYQNAGVGIPKGHLANFGRRCFNSKSGGTWPRSRDACAGC